MRGSVNHDPKKGPNKSIRKGLADTLKNIGTTPYLHEWIPIARDPIELGQMVDTNLGLKEGTYSSYKKKRRSTTREGNGRGGADTLTKATGTVNQAMVTYYMIMGYLMTCNGTYFSKVH
jgi:hypothetical protein